MLSPGRQNQLAALAVFRFRYAIKRSLSYVEGMTLDRAPLRQRLLLQDASSAGAIRRLAALGLRRGAEVTLLHATSGGGRVVLVGGTRIALGPGVLRHVQVAVVS